MWARRAAFDKFEIISRHSIRVVGIDNKNLANVWANKVGELIEDAIDDLPPINVVVDLQEYTP